jgi:MFS family permease
VHNNLIKRYIKRNFFLGVLNGILYNLAFAFTSASTVLPLFMSKLTASRILIGLASTLESVGWFLPQILMAVATLHYPNQMPFYRKTAILRGGSFCLFTLCIFLFGEKDPLFLLLSFFIFFTIYSMGGGLAGVAFTHIVGKTIPQHKRGSFFGMRIFFGGILAVLGGIIVRKLLNQYQFPLNFGVIFLLAGFFIIIALLSFSLIKEPEAYAPFEKKSLKENFLKGIRIFREDRRFKKLIIVRVLIGTYMMGLPFYVIFAREVLSVPQGLVGIFLSCEMAGYVLSNLLWGYLSNRVSNSLVLFLTALTSSLPPAILLVCRLINLPLEWFFFIFFFLGATHSGTIIGGTNYLLEISTEKERPIYIGFMNSLVGPTIFLSGVGGLIIQLSSFTLLYFIVLVAAMVAVFQSLRLISMGSRITQA